MKHFAIRQKSTGMFLPASKRRMGFTNDIPVDGTIVPPRLFNKTGAAKNALRWWLDGPWRGDWDYESGDCMGAVAINPRIPRDPDDMEIVIIKLEVHDENQA